LSKNAVVQNVFFIPFCRVFMIDPTKRPRLSLLPSIPSPFWSSKFNEQNTRRFRDFSSSSQVIITWSDWSLTLCMRVAYPRRKIIASGFPGSTLWWSVNNQSYSVSPNRRRLTLVIVGQGPKLVFWEHVKLDKSCEHMKLDNLSGEPLKSTITSRPKSYKTLKGVPKGKVRSWPKNMVKIPHFFRIKFPANFLLVILMFLKLFRDVLHNEKISMKL